MQAAKKSFWERTKDWFTEPNLAEIYSEPVPDEPVPTTPTGVLPPARPTGLVLDPRTALSINAVYRAVDILKTSVSQLPLFVERAGVEIDSPGLVTKPDARTTQTQFLSLTTHSLATYGNCYWRLHRAVEAPFEPVASIEVLNPELVYVDWQRGRKVYRYGNTSFADWQVQHLMIFPAFESGTNVVKGVGPIQANRTELQAVLQRNEWLSDFYRNGAMPNGILSTDQALPAGVPEEISEQWANLIAANRTPVLQQGIDYKAISLDPEKAMYHASAQKDVVDVARMFGIPANWMLAAIDGTSMTYTNLTDVERQFIRQTLMQYVTAIEDAFTALLPRGQKAKFNLNAFLRGSTKERYEAHKLALDAGFMTKDEVRALEGLPINSNEGDASSN